MDINKKENSSEMEKETTEKLNQGENKKTNENEFFTQTYIPSRPKYLPPRLARLRGKGYRNNLGMVNNEENMKMKINEDERINTAETFTQPSRGAQFKPISSNDRQYYNYHTNTETEFNEESYSGFNREMILVPTNRCPSHRRYHNNYVSSIPDRKDQNIFRNVPEIEFSKSKWINPNILNKTNNGAISKPIASNNKHHVNNHHTDNSSKTDEQNEFMNTDKTASSEDNREGINKNKIFPQINKKEQVDNNKYFFNNYCTDNNKERTDMFNDQETNFNEEFNKKKILTPTSKEAQYKMTAPNSKYLDNYYTNNENEQNKFINGKVCSSKENNGNINREEISTQTNIGSRSEAGVAYNTADLQSNRVQFPKPLEFQENEVNPVSTTSANKKTSEAVQEGQGEVSATQTNINHDQEHEANIAPINNTYFFTTVNSSPHTMFTNFRGNPPPVYSNVNGTEPQNAATPATCNIMPNTIYYSQISWPIPTNSLPQLPYAINPQETIVNYSRNPTQNNHLFSKQSGAISNTVNALPQFPCTINPQQTNFNYSSNPAQNNHLFSNQSGAISKTGNTLPSTINPQQTVFNYSRNRKQNNRLFSKQSGAISKTGNTLPSTINPQQTVFNYSSNPTQNNHLFSKQSGAISNTGNALPQLPSTINPQQTIYNYSSNPTQNNHLFSKQSGDFSKTGNTLPSTINPQQTVFNYSSNPTQNNHLFSKQSGAISNTGNTLPQLPYTINPQQTIFNYGSNATQNNHLFPKQSGTISNTLPQLPSSSNPQPTIFNYSSNPTQNNHLFSKQSGAISNTGNALPQLPSTINPQQTIFNYSRNPENNHLFSRQSGDISNRAQASAAPGTYASSTNNANCLPYPYINTWQDMPPIEYYNPSNTHSGQFANKKKTQDSATSIASPIYLNLPQSQNITNSNIQYDGMLSIDLAKVLTLSPLFSVVKYNEYFIICHNEIYYHKAEIIPNAKTLFNGKIYAQYSVLRKSCDHYGTIFPVIPLESCCNTAYSFACPKCKSCIEFVRGIVSEFNGMREFPTGSIKIACFKDIFTKSVSICTIANLLASRNLIFTHTYRSGHDDFLNQPWVADLKNLLTRFLLDCNKYYHDCDHYAFLIVILASQIGNLPIYEWLQKCMFNLNLEALGLVTVNDKIMGPNKPITIESYRSCIAYMPTSKGSIKNDDSWLNEIGNIIDNA